MKRSPLRPTRREPRRRAPERVVHQRIKPRAGTSATAEQQEFWSSLPPQCQGCGGAGECVHHLLSDASGKVGRRDHWFVVRLCHSCHNLGTLSVHLLGSEARYREVHGVDLVQAAIFNNARRNA